MGLKYASIDIETTGLDAARCQIIELAVVAETGDWTTPVEELPSYHCFVDNGGPIVGEAQALAWHGRILAELAKPVADRSAPTVQIDWLAKVIESFLTKHLGPPPWTVAGKNFGTFDARFLERLKGWERPMLRPGVFDAGQAWLDPATDDRVPPTAECLRRANVTPGRPHHALDDALAVVKLHRKAYARQKLPAPAAA